MTAQADPNTVNRGDQLNPSHVAHHQSRGASPSTAQNNASQAGRAGQSGQKK